MRTDPHRPSVIDPTEYRFVAFGWQPEDGPYGLPGVAQAERKALQEHMDRTGGRWSGHAHGGTCGVCGASALYTVVFYHEPTNTYIRTGNICADKMEYAYDEGAFDAFKTALKADRALRAGLRKGRALAEDHDALDAWKIFEQIRTWQREGWPEEWASLDVPKEWWTIVDIFTKLVRYGDLSDKQWEYVKVLPARVALREQRKKQWAAEKEQAPLAPTGRVEVTGKVLKLKWQEYGFREVPKMVVKASDGWALYCTVPGALFSAAPGNDIVGLTITIKVTLTPSDDDPKFAFGKRPSLVSVVVDPV